MGTYTLQNAELAKGLIRCAYESDEPVVIFDGDEERLIAMTPAVFERILFDSDLLNCHGRKTIGL